MIPARAPSGGESPSEIWDRLRAQLASQVGRDALRNWIEPLTYLGSDQGVGRFSAPTGFIGAWVSRNYGEAIRALLVQDGQPVVRL
jgi:chromosomal replication initiation ATPase DnaA